MTDTMTEPVFTSGDLDLEERSSLRRVVGLSTELTDVTEVEYRQLRLERVVLVGVWTEGTAEDAENSMAELALLAETAGSTVLNPLKGERERMIPFVPQYVKSVDREGRRITVDWKAEYDA